MDPQKRQSSKSRNISPILNDEKLICEIILLDPTQANYIVAININDFGCTLLDNVCTQMGGILEKDYFGLRYLDKHGQRQWLELNKPVYKQVKDKSHQKATQMFSFRFKHYPKYPCEDLKQDLSRYLLYLQLRRDLYRGRLVGNSSEQYQMAALILQAEIGEFDMIDLENTIKICDLKILPHITRKSEMKIISIHETLKSLDTKEAEKRFLEEASKLQTYGVEPIPVKDQKGNELFVGIVEEGISTFNGSKRAHTFPWQNILKLSYSHKMFMFQVYMDQRKHILGFKCESTHAACALWKWALDRKYFFTLDKGSQARRSRSGGSLFRKKKIHTFIGMSQKELTQSCENLQIIPQPHVARAQSMMTLMRSISSRNDSSLYKENVFTNNVSNINKGYATLPRSHGIKSFYSENNEDSDGKTKKNNRINSNKQKSPSAAVGAVLDFMQALKDSPIIHRSSQSNFAVQTTSKSENDSNLDESDANVVSEMMEIVDQESRDLNLAGPEFTLTQKASIDCEEFKSSDSVEILNQNFQFPFVVMLVTLVFFIILYGFGIIFHVHSSDRFYDSNGQITSIVGWLCRMLQRLFFKDKEI